MRSTSGSFAARDNLGSSLGIISGLGSFPVWDHFRSGIISGLGIICGAVQGSYKIVCALSAINASTKYRLLLKGALSHYLVTL